jgi:hypothetical protein
VSSASLLNVDAFVPAATNGRSFAGINANTNTKLYQSSNIASTGKPTGTSFLPQETIDRAQDGTPLEKIKLEKDGTTAFVDVYEYARKIREGEMTWEDLDKADLESVRYTRYRYVICTCSYCCTIFLLLFG